MNQPVQPPKPDEKAQIVLNGPNTNPLILRYKTVKKAEKDYKTLQDAWKRLYSDRGSKPTNPIVVLKGDMFEAVVNLHAYAAASLVDIEKRVKFVAYG